MTPLGKPLVFHLKYMAEMEHLSGELEERSERNQKDIDDAARIQEMVCTVGAAASEQVADFLDQCDKGIMDHFTGLGLGPIVKKRKRTLVLREWGSDVVVGVSSVTNGWLCYSVMVASPSEVHASVEKEVCGIIVPRLWSKGGRNGADAVWNILGGWPHSRSGEGLVYDKGLIALACIPIKAQPPESFDVDRDPLIEEVTKVFARISAAQATAIANLNAGLKKSDED